MMMIGVQRSPSRARESGVSMVEFLVALSIVGFTIASIITGYILAAQKTEWSTASSAAQRLALQRLEQARGARWDLYANPPITNQLSQLNTTNTVPLEIPDTGGNPAMATVRTTAAQVSAVPPLYMIRVEVEWSYGGRGPFTNRVMTYRAPDS